MKLDTIYLTVMAILFSALVYTTILRQRSVNAEAKSLIELSRAVDELEKVLRKASQSGI